MSLRHATAMADLYYFVANPVVENTHDKPTPSLRPGFPMSQCMSRPMSQCMLSQKLNLVNFCDECVATACDSVRQRATGVSPVAKLVASLVAAIFHSILFCRKSSATTVVENTHD